MSEYKRITWNEMWMNIACEVAKRSADPKTQVGAVLVKDNLILGIGYNGAPKNFKLSFDWNTTEKYKYVIHAEMNAIANSRRSGIDLYGSSLYVTHSPCNECIKLIVQFGIKKVYYKNKYKNFELTETIAENSGVELIQL